MSSSRQLALLVDTPQPGRRKKESRRLYRAITSLRFRGYSVRRCGHDHLVGRRQVTTRELMMLADELPSLVMAA